MRVIRLEVEYLAPPFFKANPDEMGHATAEELGLSARLAKAIEKWDQEFQDTFDSAYPPDSRDLTPDELLSHNRRGRELALQVQEELGQSATVVFVPLK